MALTSFASVIVFHMGPIILQSGNTNLIKIQFNLIGNMFVLLLNIRFIVLKSKNTAIVLLLSNIIVLDTTLWCNNNVII